QQSLASAALQPTAPAGAALQVTVPVGACCPCGLAVAGRLLYRGPWPQPVAPLQGALATPGRPLTGIVFQIQIEKMKEVKRPSL
ncbi:hypothetical protein BHM03_00044510, partial [Ensete ventricosum]